MDQCQIFQIQVKISLRVAIQTTEEIAVERDAINNIFAEIL
jgi:hypothetical protein